MDFVGTLVRLAPFLDENGQRYALIGGLALAAYGNVRSTLDLELAVDGDAQEGLIRFMESLGFDTLYRSSGYSNHLHTDEAMGRVNFVFVRGDTADSLFDEANMVEGPDGHEERPWEDLPGVGGHPWIDVTTRRRQGRDSADFREARSSGALS